VILAFPAESAEFILGRACTSSSDSVAESAAVCGFNRALGGEGEPLTGCTIGCCDVDTEENERPDRSRDGRRIAGSCKSGFSGEIMIGGRSEAEYNVDVTRCKTVATRGLDIEFLKCMSNLRLAVRPALSTAFSRSIADNSLTGSAEENAR